MRSRVAVGMWEEGVGSYRRRGKAGTTEGIKLQYVCLVCFLILFLDLCSKAVEDHNIFFFLFWGEANP